MYYDNMQCKYNNINIYILSVVVIGGYVFYFVCSLKYKMAKLNIFFQIQ
jgi:hypothetical protein